MLRYDIRTGARKIKTKTLLAFSGAGLGAAGLAMAVVMPLAAKAATTVVVTPTNTQGWSTADTRANGHVTYVTDNTAPLGNGALDLTTDSTPAPSQDKAQYMHSADIALSDVSTLSYSTKQNAATCPCGDASYQLPANLLGTSGFTTLVFEPYWQNSENPDAAPVTSGDWQSWDVSSGLFWSSKTIGCENGTITAGAGGSPFYTLAQIEAACPNANVIGFGVNIGSGNPGYDIEVDAVTFNDTTYDFEVTEPTVTVTIDKYVDGQQATAVNANNTSFPMVSTWSANNIGSGSGSYDLSPTGFNNPNPYFATTSDMSLGADYTTNEVLGSAVGAQCTLNGTPYALVGYTTGDTLAAAAAGTPSTTVPSFTNLQKDQYVIVWNKTCKSLTSKDQCKDNGWKDYGVFKNQGDCVSYVATNGKNQPSGH